MRTTKGMNGRPMMAATMGEPNGPPAVTAAPGGIASTVCENRERLNDLHTIVDEIEGKLFGPSPAAMSDGPKDAGVFPGIVAELDMTNASLAMLSKRLMSVAKAIGASPFNGD